MPETITPNFEASLEFLRSIHPDRLWMLTAIHPDKKRALKGATFNAPAALQIGNEQERVKDWLKKHNKNYNIYYSLGEPVTILNKVKAERTDIKAVHYLHVDLDPRAGEDIAEERARILKILKDPPEGIPKPTGIVFSGGGYQGFWKLYAPIEIGGNLEKAETAKRYNIQLELLLGGDNCHNIDRIMRLPGTVNYPDERKKKKGRVPALAEIVEWNDDRVYPISVFTAAPEVQNGSLGFNFTPASVQVSGNIKRLASLDELPAGVPAVCKVIIAQGYNPDDPKQFAKPGSNELDKSRALLYVCCELVRAGCDNDTVYSIITDPEFKISESVLNKGRNVERYALRQISRAHDEAIHPKLRELNDDYAVIGNVGGKCRVLTEKEEQIGEIRRSLVYYQSFADFRNFFCNQFIAGKKKNKRTKELEDIQIAVGNWWLTHTGRRTYKTVIFAPDKNIPGAYNLWRGFAYNACPGDFSLFLDHVRYNICLDDENTYNYVIGWLARAVQFPAEQGHTAIVLRGRQGTGKGRFANHFGALFGRHYLPIRDSIRLFGQFNAHLRDCVVLFADEAFWAGHKKHESLLKSLITEPMVVSEQKGVDAEASQNFVHLIMASNEEWVVPADVDDRRFLVLDVGDRNMRDTVYFGRIKEQMENGGYEGLLHYLMNYDLSEYNVWKIPQTPALQEQKIRTFSAYRSWWYEKLREGKVFSTDDDWPAHVYADNLCYDFVRHCKLWENKARANKTLLGTFLAKMVPKDHELRVQLSGTHTTTDENGESRSVKRPYAYMLPSLEVCRKRFDEVSGGPYSWAKLKEVTIEKKEEDIL